MTTAWTSSAISSPNDAYTVVASCREGVSRLSLDKSLQRVGWASSMTSNNEAWLHLDSESLRGGLSVVPKADHPSRTRTLTLTGTLRMG